MKLKQLKKIGIEQLEKYKVEDAISKINILLQFMFELNKTELILKEGIEVEKVQEDTFFKYLSEMIQGRPIQYITNHQEFMGLPFYVDENVLIPQPDTEILVENCIETLQEIVNERNKFEIRETSNQLEEEKKQKKDTIKVLDLCTGSGAIAVSIENYWQSLKKTEFILELYASDISEEALKIAKKNANFNNKDTKTTFLQSNMFEKIKEIDFDIIVSNPPYIETQTISQLSKEVQQEPHLALDGGEDGLKFYRIITKEAKRYLKENGNILIEIGYQQKEQVIHLLKEAGYSSITCKQDLNGNDRVIKCRYGDRSKNDMVVVF